MTSRRTLLAGIVGFVACAPAIVRASSIMPVKRIGFASMGIDYGTDDMTMMLSISEDGVNWKEIGEMIQAGASGVFTSPKPVAITSGMTLRVTGPMIGESI